MNLAVTCISTCVGVFLGFSLQIGLEYFHERQRKRRSKAAFIFCLKDFIQCVEVFSRCSSHEHYWDSPLWRDNQTNFATYYPVEYEQFCPAVSAVNHNSVIRPFQNKGLNFYWITADYPATQKVAKEVLEILEGKNQKQSQPIDK